MKMQRHLFKSLAAVLAAASILFNVTDCAVYAAEPYGPGNPSPQYVRFYDENLDGTEQTIAHLTIEDSTKEFLLAVYRSDTSTPVPIKTSDGIRNHNKSQSELRASFAAEDTINNLRLELSWHVLGNATVDCTDVALRFTAYLPGKSGPCLVIATDATKGQYTQLFSENDMLGQVPHEIMMTVQVGGPDWMDRFSQAVQMVKDIVRNEINITESDTYEDAMRKINVWICENWTYDSDYRMADLLTCVTDRRGVCNQISLFTEIAADYCGIQCDTEIGYDMTGGDGHEWNKVLIGGLDRYLDCTWNLNVYRNRYFLMTKEEFGKTHVWNSEVMGPGWSFPLHRTEYGTLEPLSIYMERFTGRRLAAQE